LLDNPLEIVVYDKDFNVTGFVVDPLFENIVPSWDDQGYGNFRLAADNPHIDAIEEPGARVTVVYDGWVALSGPVTSWDGDILSGGNVTYQVLDDRHLADDTVLFVAPDNPLMPESISDLGQAWKRPGGDLVPGQVNNQDGYYQWPDSVTTAEAAIKWVVRDQMIERLGHPITIKPDLGRGGPLDRDVLPRIRFDPVREAMNPILNAYNLGIRFWQDPYGKTINFDVVERGVWPQELTVEAGIIVGGTYQRRAPTATRPIIGGNGETAARAFYGREGRGRLTDRELTYGRILEVFRDSTNGQMIWPENLPEEKKVVKYGPFVMTPANWKLYMKTLLKSEADGLAEGAAKTNLALKLAETEDFRFGGTSGIQIGDVVKLNIRGATYVDSISSAQLVFTRDDGFAATPIVGDYEDDPDAALATYVSNLTKAIRRQATRK